MIGIPAQCDQNGVKDPRLIMPSMDSLQEKIFINTQEDFQVKSDETSDAFSTLIESSVTGLQDSFSFLSLTNTIRDYPDTGESGDAYDAEVSLTVDQAVPQRAFVRDPNSSYCELSISIGSQYNQWDD